MKKILFAVLFVSAFVGAVGAADLSGTASVNVTSDTAANAKDMAFDEARRQIITESLSQYSNQEQLRAVINQTSGADLTNLIASSSIEGEKQSDTTYSANITMTVDRNAAKQWMTDNNIQNWLTDNNSGDVFVLQAVMSDKVANWMELKQIARAEGLDLATKYINGNQVTVELPLNSRTAFTIAIRERGWRFYDQDGILRIWK